MKLLLAIITFLSTSSLFAVDIDSKNRVKNRPPGYCAWCCLEMLGKHHKIEPLYDLVEQRTKDKPILLLHSNGTIEMLPVAGAVPTNIKIKLDELKVKFTMYTDGNTKNDLLLRSNQEGCVVDIKKGIFGPSAHAILMTYYDEEKIEFIDPNNPDYVYHVQRKWFDDNWTGRVIILEK